MKHKRRIPGEWIALIIAVVLLGNIISCSIRMNQCIVDGCRNLRSDHSRYCYKHDPYGTPYSGNYDSNKPKSNKSKSYSSDSDDDISDGRRYDHDYKPKKDKITSPYKDYDAGYDDVYEDGDYDWDRYQKDDDYADGVDDAIEDWEEFGDDW